MAWEFRIVVKMRHNKLSFKDKQTVWIHVQREGWGSRHAGITSEFKHHYF